MTEKKNIFVIIGSAGKNSANQKLVDSLAYLSKEDFNLTIYKDLKPVNALSYSAKSLAFLESLFQFLTKCNHQFENRDQDFFLDQFHYPLQFRF
jgi:hypothetical protein